MSTITGTVKYFGSHRYDNFDDTLVGTWGDDEIYGLGGDDTLWGSLGGDEIHGGRGDDLIVASDPLTPNHTGYWGDDFAYGGAGSDTLDFRMSWSDLVLFGDQTFLAGGDTIDYVYAGAGDDWLYGGGGDDIMEGNGGGDVLYGDLATGGFGHDQLSGGNGVDTLMGGEGDDFLAGDGDGDWLTGGAGADHFAFAYGHSGLSWEAADTVTDFNYHDDLIDTPIPGTPDNYVRSMCHYGTGFDGARAEAASLIAQGNTYAFITDQIDGYLFADLNQDGAMDTGVELTGVDNLGYLNWYDIV
jgi:Ca2+-binding RTX toxin-like protein